MYVCMYVSFSYVCILLRIVALIAYIFECDDRMDYVETRVYSYMYIYVLQISVFNVQREQGKGIFPLPSLKLS
jgi:hypothetical protein